MGMSVDYGPGDERESVATLNRAVDLGATLIDTAESYGPFENERLIARALGHRRDEVILATKFGLDFADDGTAGSLDGRPEHVQRAVERSLRHLDTDVIDLYYMHRVDPHTPIEDTAGALAERVREIAEARGATPGEIALAWVNAQGAVAVPGTKRRRYLEENARAADLVLSHDERAALSSAVPAGEVAGARYTEQALASTNR
ncbi:aldo/keto reductase [Streptomyces fagopyri]|uniref:aldo/keto reductase n=1 Tax=Streptomyces fagopyri TaxID=2662397 RepID=UPI00340B83D0